MPRRLLVLCLLCLSLVPATACAETINLGYPGENTAQLDARFDTVLALHPAWIVILAGANDALNPAAFLTPEQSRKNLLDMITRAHQAGAHVVLVTVHEPDYTRLLARHKPEQYGDNPPAQRLAELDSVVLELAAQNHLPLADFRAVLQAHGGANLQLSTDGVHLTHEGYGLLAATVRSKLPRHLPAAAKVVCFGDSLTYGIGVRPPGDAPETPDTYPAQLRALLEH